MSEPMQIGNVTIMPGETKRGGIPIPSDNFDRERVIPIIVVRGVEDGPTIWLNGATHGDEPEGPYSIFMTLRELDPLQMRGTVVAVPVMNVDAFTAGKRGNPLDGFTYDMNRCYPGRPGWISNRTRGPRPLGSDEGELRLTNRHPLWR